MKQALLLTTAICGLYVLMGVPDASAGTIRTTTTTTYSKDFPDGSARTSTSTSVSKSGCDVQCPYPRPRPPNYVYMGKECSCFDYNTMVLMSDGSTKRIGDIESGDETIYGVVHQKILRRFDQAYMMTEVFQRVYRGGLYDYRGILVTGNHVVHNGARWMQVADACEALPVSADDATHIGNVYNLDVEGGIIPVVNPDGELIAFLDDKQAFVMERIAV